MFHAEVRGLTISRVQGHGGEMEHVENYRGTTLRMALAEKVRIEIGVSNHFVEPTVQAILGAARTGEVGDGKVMVLSIEKIYRIRTGEEEQAAVTFFLAPDARAETECGNDDVGRPLPSCTALSEFVRASNHKGRFLEQFQ